MENTKEFMLEILNVQKRINRLNEEIRSLQSIQNRMINNKIEKETK